MLTSFTATFTVRGAGGSVEATRWAEGVQGVLPRIVADAVREALDDVAVDGELAICITRRVPSADGSFGIDTELGGAA